MPGITQIRPYPPPTMRELPANTAQWIAEPGHHLNQRHWARLCSTDQFGMSFRGRRPFLNSS